MYGIAAAVKPKHLDTSAPFTLAKIFHGPLPVFPLPEVGQANKPVAPPAEVEKYPHALPSVGAVWFPPPWNDPGGMDVLWASADEVSSDR